MRRTGVPNYTSCLDAGRARCTARSSADAIPVQTLKQPETVLLRGLSSGALSACRAHGAADRRRIDDVPTVRFAERRVCFAGCGKGDLVGFHMRLKGLAFREAVRDLVEGAR